MTETDTRRIETPPGSIIVITVPGDSGPEQTVGLATELHRQTGLPVVVTDGTADVEVQERPAAITALDDALTDAADAEDAVVEVSADQLLDRLRQEGWLLVRVSGEPG